MILTVIIGMFPFCVHAMLMFLTLHLVTLTLSLNPVVKVILHVILVPGIKNLVDTVTAKVKHHRILIVRPVVLYLQQTSAVAGHRLKMLIMNLKIHSRLHAYCTCSPLTCSA